MTLPSLTSLSAVLFASEVALAIWKRAGAKASAGKDRRSLVLLWLAGLALFLVGLVIRWAAIIHLGRFFTVNVAIAEDHRLITTGPYRYVRHPSYSGSLLLFLGLGLCTLNFYALVAIFLPICAAFLWRIHVEETALRAAFGDRYKSYAAKTRRIIPWVY